jgi:hypothetical protein
MARDQRHAARVTAGTAHGGPERRDFACRERDPSGAERIEEVNGVAEKKISPKAPAGSSSKQAATRVTKQAKMAKLSKQAKLAKQAKLSKQAKMAKLAKQTKLAKQ